MKYYEQDGKYYFSTSQFGHSIGEILEIPIYFIPAEVLSLTK